MNFWTLCFCHLPCMPCELFNMFQPSWSGSLWIWCNLVIGIIGSWIIQLPSSFRDNFSCGFVFVLGAPPHQLTFFQFHYLVVGLGQGLGLGYRPILGLLELDKVSLCSGQPWMLHWGVAVVFLAGHCMGCWSQFSLNSPGRLPVWCLITPRIYLGLYCAEDRASYFAG